MSDQTVRILIAGALLVHGIGHTLGFWRPVNSWLLGGLSESARRTISSIFWTLSAIGFIAASLGFLGFIVPNEWWRELAIASSLISLTGLILFIGNWPVFNTVGAIGMNILVLVSLLFVDWLPDV
jgi:hypothetical protein